MLSFFNRVILSQVTAKSSLLINKETSFVKSILARNQTNSKKYKVFWKFFIFIFLFQVCSC